MKAAIPYLLIAIAGAAICFLLMRGCGKSAPLQQSAAAVDSVNQRHDDSIRSALAEVDRLRGDSSTQADIIDNQARQLAWYEAQLSNTGQDIGSTIQVMDSVRIIHDTPALVSSCDTLEQQVKDARVQIHGFRLATDSLIDAYQVQGRIKDSTTQAFRSAFLHADSATIYNLTQYNALYKKQQRAILTEKVLGGAAAAFLLGLLIKK